MSKIKLERELSRWAAIKPEAIAISSPAAVTYFAADAQKDISALAAALAVKDAEIARLREALTEAQKEITGKPLATGDGHEHDLWLRGLMRTALREPSL